MVGLVLGLPSQLRAEAVLTIAAPAFLIPLAGQSGSLTVYSDGSAPTTAGFNVLGSQTFTLGAGATSTGTMTLNMEFSGPPLGGPIAAAFLKFSVYDLDLLTDNVTSKVTLKEIAILDAINHAPIGTPIKLKDYLPAGTTSTDDKWVNLLPIPLIPTLGSDDFTDPFIVSLKLTAVAKNTGSSSVRLTNTPEKIIPSLKLSLTPIEVPEPSTLLLLGCGAAATCLRRRRLIAA
jgi:hypothetical protein